MIDLAVDEAGTVKVSIMKALDVIGCSPAAIEAFNRLGAHDYMEL